MAQIKLITCYNFLFYLSCNPNTTTCNDNDNESHFQFEFTWKQVIEPVLKVHRAYRYISKSPQCDRYVLCQLNAAALDQQQQQQQERELQQQQQQSKSSGGLIAGVSPKIVKIGSMGAAIFISTETGTPFWTLFGVINAPYNCEVSSHPFHIPIAIEIQNNLQNLLTF